MPGEYDDTLEWPFQGEVTVELLNQLEDTGHYNNYGTHIHFNNTNTQYLMNDTLYFRVSVYVHSKTKPWLAGAI